MIFCQFWSKSGPFLGNPILQKSLVKRNNCWSLNFHCFKKSIFCDFLSNCQRTVTHTFFSEKSGFFIPNSTCSRENAPSPKHYKPVRNAFGSITSVGKLKKSQNRVYTRSLRFFDFRPPLNNRVPSGQLDYTFNEGDVPKELSQSL